MIDRDVMMELCSREAPEERCNEIRMDGYGFCALDVGHSGPHAYESYFPSKAPETTDGMVLHCASCKMPLTKKITSTNTGYWCDTCCYPPSLSDTYLARPKPKVKVTANPFENDRRGSF